MSVEGSVTDTLKVTSTAINGGASHALDGETILRKRLPPDYLRSKSGAIEAAGGTLYVSRPFRSSKDKKSKAVVSFVPRTSHFDISNERSGANEFRGFFTLFWISIFLLVVQNYVHSFDQHGYPIEMAFARMFSRHALTLALSDGVLVLSTGLCVPFAKALKSGKLQHNKGGVVIQHTFQAMVLAVAVNWTFNRKWPWVQSGFFTLHSLVMIMKIHSYMSTNGYLQTVHDKHTKLLDALHEITKTHASEKQIEDPWEEALDVARAHMPAISVSREGSEGSRSLDGTPSLTPDLDGTTRSFIDGDVAAALRKRIAEAPGETKAAVGLGLGADASIHAHDAHSAVAELTAKVPAQRPDPDYAVLVHHPNDEISNLAEQLLELDAELTSTGVQQVRWPENISYRNFAEYQLIPSLVYELEYPRTDRIRPVYVFEKTVATFGTFALLYTMTENFIIPHIPTKEQSFWRSMLDLALPFMVAYLLLFYIIFECICNGFAELSYFADRQFYEDWARADRTRRWNSTSWDEFARKWNKPVHNFLLRHVYASSISAYKLSRKSAMTLTFLLSAAVHELVMAVVTKKIRMYLFLMQLFQIPLIALGRIPAIKRNKLMGNVVFWVGLYAGFPLLCVAYCVY